MKKYFLFFFFYCIGLNAQIINFPDANFKAKLLQADVNNNIANYLKIDTNNNGEIEVSEAEVIHTLRISNSSISNLIGINNFINLRTLYCSNNQISSLNLLGLNNLNTLILDNNSLTNIYIYQVWI